MRGDRGAGPAYAFRTRGLARARRPNVHGILDEGLRHPPSPGLASAEVSEAWVWAALAGDQSTQVTENSVTSQTIAPHSTECNLLCALLLCDKPYLFVRPCLLPSRFSLHVIRSHHPHHATEDNTYSHHTRRQCGSSETPAQDDCQSNVNGDGGGDGRRRW